MMVCVVSRCGKPPRSSQRGMNSFGIGSTSINREGAALRRLILEFVSSFLHHIPLIKFLHKGCVKILSLIHISEPTRQEASRMPSSA